MNCEYCNGDRDGYVAFLPKTGTGFNAFVWKDGRTLPHIAVSGRGGRSNFLINYCPMCGKRLREDNDYARI